MRKINFDIFLLLSRDNIHSRQSLNCINRSNYNNDINIYISTTEDIFNRVSNLIDQNKVKIILNKNKFNTCWDHMISLTHLSQSKYLTFIHDDDLFEKDYLIKSYYFLCKYEPIALSNRARFIDEFSNLHKRRNK